uniref:Uncharacterized protein n=1 Tax=Physcomitrium patens TaxID=3218 RepID=A9TKU3_PHYPA|nr:hypothetical protein PHYPA_020241 [Physcomitrium patens]
MSLQAMSQQAVQARELGRHRQTSVVPVYWCHLDHLNSMPTLLILSAREHWRLYSGMHPGSARTLLEGVPSKVDDGDWRCTSGIGCTVAAATVYDGTIAIASVLIKHVWDADKGIQMVGLGGAMVDGRELGRRDNGAAGGELANRGHNWTWTR